MKHTGKLFFASAFLTGCLALCLGSCRNFVEPERPEDYLKFGANEGSITWSSVFESFWTGMNNNYLFWSDESIDWDDVYDIYKPKFAALDFNEEADSGTAFEYFKEMTKDLRDGHYALQVNDNFGNSIDIGPAYARLFEKFGDNLYQFRERRDADGREAAFRSLPEKLRHSDYFAEEDGTGTARKDAVETYIDPSSYSFFQVSAWDKWESISNFKVTTGRIRESEGFILYFAFSGFAYGVPGIGDSIVSQYQSFDDRGVYDDIKANYPNITDDDDLWDQIKTDRGENDEWLLAVEMRRVTDITDQFFDDLKDDGLKGVIIDLRNNGGGYNLDLSYLWGKLISTERVAAYYRGKLGNNRLDYSPRMPLTIFPDPNTREDVTVPIAVLVNKGSISCAEISAMFFSTLPNAYIVGGETFGGQGTLTDYRALNGGQFTAPCLKLVYTPSVQTRTVDNILYEGIGFPPDYPVDFDETAYQALQGGQDTRLDRAIRVIRGEY